MGLWSVDAAGAVFRAAVAGDDVLSGRVLGKVVSERELLAGEDPLLALHDDPRLPSGARLYRLAVWLFGREEGEKKGGGKFRVYVCEAASAVIGAAHRNKRSRSGL